MSETIEQAAPEATEQPAVEQEAPVVEQQEATEPVEGVEQPASAAEPEAPAEPEAETPPAKPSQGDRRFAIMTRRHAELKAQFEAEQKARQAAEALLNANRPEGEQPQRFEQPQDIEAAAAQLVAQREFNAKRTDLINSGVTEFGQAKWDANAEVLMQLGAAGNSTFMETLVHIPNGARLAAHLAEDADAVVELLGKSPVAMAAEMGRMAAEMAKPVRALSNAPRPVARIDAPVVVRERTSADPDLSMAQYVAIRNAEIAKRKASGLR